MALVCLHLPTAVIQSLVGLSQPSVLMIWINLVPCYLLHKGWKHLSDETLKTTTFLHFKTFENPRQCKLFQYHGQCYTFSSPCARSHNRFVMESRIEAGIWTPNVMSPPLNHILFKVRRFRFPSDGQCSLCQQFNDTERTGVYKPCVCARKLWL